MKKNTSAIPFLDILFNMLLLFVSLFMISFVMIKIDNKKQNVESKAEFIITMTWDNNDASDVDLYVESPLGRLVFFKRLQDGLLHLERDDLGHINDTIRTPFGLIKYDQNREIVSIRGYIPGEYTVNVHMFRQEYKKDGGKTPVTVQIDKMNPFGMIDRKTVDLGNNGDEQTICRFTLNKEGKVTEISRLPKKLTTLDPEPSWDGDYMGD